MPPTLTTPPELLPVLAELRALEPLFHTGHDAERIAAPTFWEVGASGQRATVDTGRRFFIRGRSLPVVNDAADGRRGQRYCRVAPQGLQRGAGGSGCFQRAMLAASSISIRRSNSFFRCW